MTARHWKPILGMAVMLMVLLPTGLRAACADLRTATIAPEDVNIALVQRGLQTALEDDNPLLADGRLGSYTRTRLVQFCDMFPLPQGTDSVAGTIALAEDYGALAGAVIDWKIVASEADFANEVLPQGDAAVNGRVLPLLGPPEVTANALLGLGGADDCTAMAPLDPAAQAGMLALTALDPVGWPDPGSLCGDLDLAGGAVAITALLASLGTIETALPSGVNQALSPDFALWLGEDIATRGPRLLGSDAAVIALISDYRAANRPAAPRDFSPLYARLPASCVQTGAGGITDFYALDQPTLDALVAPVDVPALLDGLAGQGFASSSALADAVSDTLGDQVSDCTLDQISLAIASPDAFGREFRLDPDRTANLALMDDFAPNDPVIAPFVGLSAQSRAGLLAGLRGALQTATTARIMAEADAAATVLAAAAEPVPETFDTLPPGVEPFDELPVNPTIGVTRTTRDAVAASVPDPDFARALVTHSFSPAPNAEALQAAALAVLTPIAQDKITASVNRAMVQLQPALTTSWGLTETLQDAIRAAPAVTTAAQDLTPSPDGGVGLDTLVGITYPNLRLFDAALAQLSPQPNVGVLAELREKAARTAPDPATIRDLAVAQPDCGCVTRREDHSEVYGFYPFWFAPPQAEDSGPGRTVDFGMVSRIAFYGLEFRITDGGNGTLILDNESQWTFGQRAFVDAAHRHRAKADLAVQLTGWNDWTDVQISTVVQKLLAITDRFPRTQSSDMRALWAAVPNALDRPQVDGLTLIIDGYDDAGDNPGAARLVAMITLLQSELDARGQTVNIALDLALRENNTTDPVFGDLRPLLIGADPVVDKLLVFLERPTTDTKKHLRARMEAGVFQGIDRTRVLRRIIPVIPPAAHANVFQNTATGSERVPFSQFTDDLVYFQDNFAGIGFWPTPDPAAEETSAINMIFADEWYQPVLPEFLSTFEDEVDRACSVICPNRAYVAGVVAIVFALSVLLVWRSFYSGFVDRLAFKLGLVWVGGAAIFAGLLALAVCDPFAIVAPVMLFAMIAATLLLSGFYIYQSARNGPKP